MHPAIRVAMVISNRSDAPVLAAAAERGVETLVIQRTQFYQSQSLLEILQNHEVDFIVLAGFMWLMPNYLVNAYAGKIVNIHPALLPKYGGKGMYGMHVHEAVKAAGEQESGITIHYVNEHYDEGEIIFQATCTIAPDDTPQEIGRKVQVLEHQHFAPVIESILT